MQTDPYLIVRAAAVYVAVLMTAAAWLWRRPRERIVAGAILAFAWNLPIVLLLDVLAGRAGWWRFEARGGLLLGTPVDLWLAWACMWGSLPAVALPRLSLGFVALAACAIDALLMPLGAPVIRLGPHWLAGEALGLLCGLMPAQLLARWTAEDRHLGARAALQAIAFSGLLLFLIPAIATQGTTRVWLRPFDWPAWVQSAAVQVLAIPAVIGLTAVQEFATRGGGTPVPFDPPRRLVTTGVYAYVRNPMQLSGVVLMVLLGVMLGSVRVASAGVMAHLYSVGLAGWDENEDLRRRFGAAWTDYRSAVRRWVPRLRPWHRSDASPARLYVSERCGMCRDVGEWFRRRGVRHLVIVPAETHASLCLRRVTYEPADGSNATAGVEAIARALEHIHLGWAFVGFVLRLPGVAQAAQVLVDASGGGPRTIRAHS
jgi:protein-S-isoprenylcysteine O-methyltransferase Ste14